VCIDEAAFYLLAGVVRTYAPCGETPVLKAFRTHDHLSVMSGISTAGHLLTLTRTRALTGQESVTFLCHLYGYLGRRLLVIWDNATIHRSNEVKALLANGWATKIHLENFPAYAPELNPDEGVWQHLKHVELRNLCCMDLIHLNVELQLAIRQLRRKQELIQSFFAGAGLDLRG
jgi:transposase